MNKLIYDETIKQARKLDVKGENGKLWLATKTQQEISDLKAVAMINDDTEVLEYLDQVALVRQNQLGVRLGLG